jgi:SAM-dependent methyltransferase
MFSQSDTYLRFMDRWSCQLAPLMVRFARLSAPASVLDVGTGLGALASAVADAYPHATVTGIDPSSAFVEAAARTSNPRLGFLVGDAQALQFPAASFDAALSMLVLNFIPEPQQAVREMIRVTRAGGVVAAAVWDYGEGMEMLRIFWDEAVVLNPAVALHDERHVALCKRGELGALWRTSGLADIDEQPLTLEMTFESFEDYWSPFLGGVGPAGAYATSLSEVDRDALRFRLSHRLSDGHEDQPITLRARAWAVRGAVV